MKKNRAFTLMELLVVIAIIALLMAIMVPSLQKAKTIAMNVVDQSNLRQWGLIWGLYTSEYNNKFTPEGTYWNEALRDYYEDPDIRLCPLAKKPFNEGGTQPFAAWGKFKADGGLKNPYQFKDDYGSYGLNAWVLSIPENYRDIRYGNWVTESSIPFYWQRADQKNAENIPVYGDSWWTFAYPRQSDSPPPAPRQTIDQKEFGNIGHMELFCINRHQGKVNLLFMDWSVRGVGLKSLWSLKWNRQYDPIAAMNLNQQRGWPEWMRTFD